MTGSLEKIKGSFYSFDDKAPPAEVGDQMVELVIASGFVEALIAAINELDVETRKDVAVVFNHMMQRTIGETPVFLYHVQKHVALVNTLLDAYKSQDVASVTGSMLRQCIVDEQLSQHLLTVAATEQFFGYVKSPNFDVSTDAFSSFKDLLTRHKAPVAQFLEKNYDWFFKQFDGLLSSDNYVTRRQALKLLGELLLDRSNFNVMTKFIADENNLMLMMKMLKDKSKNIQFEAFHVFKVFVANPKKAPGILQILVANKQRLLKYLADFHNDKDEEQFSDEKQFLIKQIQALPDSV